MATQSRSRRSEAPSRSRATSIMGWWLARKSGNSALNSRACSSSSSSAPSPERAGRRLREEEAMGIVILLMERWDDKPVCVLGAALARTLQHDHRLNDKG